eukprot:5237487-Pyramimonas_sp.AAC.1
MVISQDVRISARRRGRGGPDAVSGRQVARARAAMTRARGARGDHFICSRRGGTTTGPPRGCGTSRTRRATATWRSGCKNKQIPNNNKLIRQSTLK